MLRDLLIRSTGFATWIRFATSIQMPVFVIHFLSFFHEFRHNFFPFAAGEECTAITGLQLPGVLDELFSYDGPLGATFSSESVYLHLWAPTAQVNAIRIINYS